MMPPVCVKCRLTMKIKKTGADVEEMMSASQPYRIWVVGPFETGQTAFALTNGCAFASVRKWTIWNLIYRPTPATFRDAQTFSLLRLLCFALGWL